MAGNWFLRTTTWTTREASVASPSITPSSGTLRLSGQVPAVSSSSASGSIDGGGEIGFAVERDFTATYQLYGYVYRDFTAIYQMVWFAYPSSGSLRMVGQAPTVAISTVWTATPTVGTVRIVGQTPTVVNSGAKSASPSVGTLRLVGQTPTVEKGAKVVAPSSGTLRLVGNQPTLSPVWLTLTGGTLRVVGQQPRVVSPFYVTPTSGTVRIRGQGSPYRDFVATYQLLSVLAYADFTATYGIIGSVSADFEATWNIEGEVDSIALLSERGSMLLNVQQQSLEIEDTRNSIMLMAA